MNKYRRVNGPAYGPNNNNDMKKKKEKIMYPKLFAGSAHIPASF